MSSQLRNFILGIILASAYSFMLAVVPAAAAPSADPDQCMNGGVDNNGVLDPLLACAGTNYANGNATKSKAHWLEGEFVSYRAVLTGLTPGVNRFRISWDVTHAGAHAVDYIGSFDATESTAPGASLVHANQNNPCGDVSGFSGCNPASPDGTSPVIPAFNTSFLPGCSSLGSFSGVQIPGQIKIWGGNFSNVSLPATKLAYAYQNTDSGGDCESALDITFYAAGTSAVVAWGGHIASQLNWGNGNSASAISGSPYHAHVEEIESGAVITSLGKKDLPLDADAIFQTLTVNKACVPANDTGTFNLKVDGVNYLDGVAAGGDAACGGTTGMVSVDADNHTAAESAGSGTSLSNYTTRLTCVDASNAVLVNNVATSSSSVAVARGDQVTCTFTNTLRTGSLEVVKSLDPSNDGGGFDLYIQDSTINSNLIDSAINVGNNGTTGKNTLVQGNYKVGESATPVPPASQPTSLNDYTTSIACKDQNNATVTPLSGSAPGPWLVPLAADKDVVCTITNQRKQGRLEVKKKLEPSNDPGRFDLYIDSTIYTNGGAGYGDGGSTAEQLVNTGIHQVGENAHTGSLSDYVSSILCKDGNGSGSDVASGSGTGPVNVTVATTSDIVCVITNSRKPRLNLVKDIIPNGDSGKFNLFIKQGATTKGSALDIGDGGAVGVLTLAVGTYTVSETAGTGTSLAGYTTNIHCDKAGFVDVNGINANSPPDSLVSEPNANVTLASGDNVTCTITNTRKASLTVTKISEGGIDTFSYTSTGGLPAPADGSGNFTLTTSSPGGIGVNKIFPFASLTASGTALTVTESDPGTTPGGWSFASLVCSKGTVNNQTVTVTILPGDTITCTYTNRKHSSIAIVKEVNIAGSNSATSFQNFLFTKGGNFSGTFQLDDDGAGGGSAACADPDLLNPVNDDNCLKSQTFGTLAPGTYTAAETPGFGWQLSQIACTGATNSTVSIGGNATFEQGDTGVSISLAAGENVTCTFTNHQAEMPLSKWYNGHLLTNCGSPSNGLITCHQDTAGGPTVAVPSFTMNLYIDGMISPPPDSLLNAADGWPGSPLASVQIPPTLDLQGIIGVNFFICEMNIPAGWTLTDVTIVADGASSHPTLLHPTEDGSNDTCFMGFIPNGTNNYELHVNNVPDGKLTIKKISYGGAGTFSFTSTGPLPSPADASGNFTIATVAHDGPGVSKLFTFSALAPAGIPVSVTESDPTTTPGGWDFANLSCTKGTVSQPNRQVAVTVLPGDDITCTYENRKRGSISIIKNAVPDSAQDFSFHPSANLSGSDFNLDDDNDPGLPKQADFLNLVTNNTPDYTVAEISIPNGWGLMSITCTDSDDGDGDPSGTQSIITFIGSEPMSALPSHRSTASIKLAAGEHLTCTFTNAELGKIVVAKQTVPDNDHSTLFTFTSSDISGFPSSNTNPDNKLLNGESFTVENIFPGTYHVIESLINDWEVTGINCVGDASGNIGSRTATYHIVGNETVTCTFVNTQHGHIIVDKVTIPPGVLDVFHFVTTGGSYHNFSLRDLDPPNDQSLLPNITYTVAELQALGYDLQNIHCVQTVFGTSTSTFPAVDSINQPVSIFLGPGDTVMCTFTNIRKPMLLITKIARFGDDRFPFDLDDVEGPTSSTISVRTAKPYYENGVRVGTEGEELLYLTPQHSYNLTEDLSGLPAWYMNNVTCTFNGQTFANHPLAVNPIDGLPPRERDLPTVGIPTVNYLDVVTCTFINTREATLAVTKLINGCEPNDNANSNKCGDFPSFDFRLYNQGSAVQDPLAIDPVTLQPLPNSTQVVPQNFLTVPPLESFTAPPSKVSDKPRGVPYSLCEMNIPAGWEAVGWSIAFTPYGFNKPQSTLNYTEYVPTVPGQDDDSVLYNPNYFLGELDGLGGTLPPPRDPGNRCINFVIPAGTERVDVYANNESGGGRMTGGGSAFATGSPYAGRVTHGFELHCDAKDNPNHLEINWAGNKFHLENLTSAECSFESRLKSRPSLTSRSSIYEGIGTGRYNGVSGYQAYWVFTDQGEPGTRDTAAILIKSPNGTTVLQVGSVGVSNGGKINNSTGVNLTFGNHQAHK